MFLLKILQKNRKACNQQAADPHPHDDPLSKKNLPVRLAKTHPREAEDHQGSLASQ